MNKQLLQLAHIRKSLTQLLSLFALLVLAFPARSQCSDITLSSQQQVDDFAQSGCTTTSRDLIVSGLDITNLNGLRNLTQVGNLEIKGTKLANLEGLNQLKLASDISISGNSSLTSLNGLSSLTDVQSEIEIDGNLLLTNLTGLSSLTLVNYTYITSNYSLTSLQGLNGLSRTVGGLYITSNPVLTTLSGLDNLRSIGANLVLISNDRMTNLTGLNSLTCVLSGDVLIERNRELTSLAGLNNLTIVSRDLEISDNPVLTSLADLSGLASIGGEIKIVDNSSLTNCAIAALCAALANPPQAITIQGNASGCASKEEVQSRCPPISLTAPEPVSSTVCAGASLTTTVGTTGNVKTYQWYKDDALLAGQTSPILSLTNVDPSASGAYRLVAVNAYSSLTATAFNLTVNPFPQDVSLSNSGPLSFTNTSVLLMASASPPATYSYHFSAGATRQGSSNTARVTTPGIYSVTITTANGCTATASTTVSGGNNPTVCRGGTAVINVVVEGDAVKYEWYKNSLTTPKLMETPQLFRGTATSSLTLINAQTNTQGNFFLKVADRSGTVRVYGPYRLTVDGNCRAREVASLEVPLRIELAPNPIQQDRLRAVVRGAEGRPLQVELVDLSGKPVRQQRWPQVDSEQRIDWDMQGQSSGLYLLQVVSGATTNTPAQRQSLKVIKP
ncbi:T9SS type A sorting domain-containing protein [Spirosoma fluminis]